MSTPVSDRDLPTEPTHVRWGVWSTYAFLAVTDPHHLAPAQRLTRGLLAAVDAACSRFRPDSCLAEVNRRPGRWVGVDPLLVDAVRVALEAAELTDGLVDPCLGRTIVSLGYDRDLGQLVERGLESAPWCPPVPRAWREVELTADAVRIPDGVALDLGATAKAWAADLVAATLEEQLGCVGVVSLGGDLRVWGQDGGNGWPVHVTERPDDDDGVTVSVTAGLATSTTLARTWRTAAGTRHHLLDPRTGLPVPAGVRTATAAGSTCVAANTASTAALVLGHQAGPWLEAHGVTARLVRADGSVATTGHWPTPDPREEAL